MGRPETVREWVGIGYNLTQRALYVGLEDSRWVFRDTELNSDDPKYLAAFWVSNQIPFVAAVGNHDMDTIRVSVNKEEVLIITIYCLPSTSVINLNHLLEELNLQLLKYPSDNVVLMGDFNAKSSLWGQGQTDCRGRMMAAFDSNVDLKIINN